MIHRGDTGTQGQTEKDTQKDGKTKMGRRLEW